MNKEAYKKAVIPKDDCALSKSRIKKMSAAPRRPSHIKNCRATSKMIQLQKTPATPKVEFDERCYQRFIFIDFQKSAFGANRLFALVTPYQKCPACHDLQKATVKSLKA